MQNNYLLQRFLRLSRPIFTSRTQSKQALNLEKLEAENEVELEGIDEEVQLKEAQIQKNREKSRLSAAHRNIIQGKIPYPEPKHWIHGTLRYQRKMYGRFGDNSNFDPTFCWPTREELELKKEYESVAQPYTIQEMVKMANESREAKNEMLRKQQEDIDNKMKKLDVWKKELLQKIQKKEADAVAAKERKERLIEEVRRHFGYTVDPRDDRFKEMLEKKEKEQKKAMKEARKKAKEDKMVDKLIVKGKAASENQDA